MSRRAFSQTLILAGLFGSAVGSAVWWWPGVFVVAVLCVVAGLFVDVEDGDHEGSRVVDRASRRRR